MSIESTHSNIDCSWCGYENSRDSQFCGNCGLSLAFDSVCPSCGVNNPDENAYCDACGALIDETRRVAATSAVGVSSSSSSTSLEPIREPLERLGIYNWTFGALAAIFVLALFLRVVSLTDTPANLVADEADNLQTVYHIMADTGPGFFELDWKPAPAFSMYMTGWSMGVFGETIVGMRLPSVALSTVSLLVFFLVARRHGLSRPSSLAGTFLLATSLWYLHFSRSGWENIHVALYALMAMLTISAAIKRGNFFLYAAAGLFAVLGLYGFMSGRTVIAALFIYLPIAFILHREDRKRLFIGYAIVLVTAFVLFAPQLANALDDIQNFNRRVDAIYVLNEQNRTQFDGKGSFGIIVEKTWDTIRGFILLDPGVSTEAQNNRFIATNRGFLDRLTGVLFWLGIAVSIPRWRQTLLWWVFFIVMIFPIQVLSTDTPHGARAVGAAPIFYLFIALGLDWLFSLHLDFRFWLRTARRVQKVLRVHGLVLFLLWPWFMMTKVPRRWLGTVVVIGLALIAYTNVSGYFNWMDQPEAAAARQPAVDAADFEIWQALQKTEAEAGRGGFNVGEWLQMKDQSQ